MLLTKIIDDLVNNELRNLSIGKPVWGDAAFSYKALIQCISLAYIELHKRFTLKKELVLLRPSENINTYVLDIAHAVSNVASSSDKYIIDTVDFPFSNNIAKIDQIYDDLNELVEFNSSTYGGDISCLDYRTLYIKNSVNYGDLTLVCRAIPEPLSINTPAELADYDLPITSMYLEALLCYAAGRAYVNRGPENTANNESAVFFSRFEIACNNIREFSLDIKENSFNNKLHQRGFV